MKKNQILVLFSGGQDSTTCLIWAIEKWGNENVHALGFDYGQKHAIELEQAKKIAELFGVTYKIFDIKSLVSGSSLTDHSQDVTAPHKINGELPSSFTAGRNILFLTIAASYGYNLGISDIVTGVCETDYSGYPDCRNEFIKKMEWALNLGLGVENLMIHTPLMFIDKAHTWRLAKQVSLSIQDQKIYDESFSPFEVVRTMTMTDYNGSTEMNDWGMGKLDNPASELRAKGYYKALEMGFI